MEEGTKYLVNLKDQPVYPVHRTCGNHSRGSWVGPRAGLTVSLSRFGPICDARQQTLKKMCNFCKGILLYTAKYHERPCERFLRLPPRGTTGNLAPTANDHKHINTLNMGYCKPTITTVATMHNSRLNVCIIRN
jgi:hypothetical protein